jgi:transcription elongation factor Elf1
MKTVRIVFQHRWYCKNCGKENLIIMDEDVINPQYYKIVECFYCGKEYKTAVSFSLYE